jgi:hypothetical protein
MPKHTFEVEYYAGHYLQDYYYNKENNTFYYFNGCRIRLMIPRFCRGYLYYYCNDINN